MSIGDNLKRIRIENGFTQDKLAESVNVARSLIAQIERGSKPLTMNLAVEIARVCNCNIDDFSKE